MARRLLGTGVGGLQTVTSLLVTGVVCATATALSAALLIPRLRRADRLDVPNHRSSHTVPTPRGGGLAIIAGTAVAALSTLLGPAWPTDAWMLLGAAVVLGLVGLTDDIRGLQPVPRLLAQVGVRAAAGAAVGGVLGPVVVPTATRLAPACECIRYRASSGRASRPDRGPLALPSRPSAPRASWTMLGTDLPRRHLLVFQDNAELGTTGSTPNSWALPRGRPHTRRFRPGSGRREEDR
ncbi:hypothetical protein GCM10012283_09990 [Phycicoccus endophyticus]|nr:hypothetical protein GCM10012283_09990 [Phycicoccus endophyticus]